MRTNKYSNIFTLSFFFALAVGLKNAGAYDETQIGDFLTSYSNGLKFLEGKYENVYIDGILEQEYIFPRTASRAKAWGSSRLEYYKSGDHVKLIRTGLHNDRSAPASELIYVDEPHRLFIVERMVGTREYRINHIGERVETSISRMDSYINKFIKAPFSFNAVPISTIIQMPGFKVKKLTESHESEGAGGVRIDFDYTPPPSVRPNTPWTTALSGWWVVDPKNGWILRQYQIAERGSSILWTGSVEYTIEHGEPKLSKVSLNDGADYRAGFKYEFECKNLLHKITPEKEFTLAAYGLGDAELPPGRASNWSPYWFFGIALLAIVISVALRRRADQ